jgi:Na+-transporting methylmalonyl-CoA/oxaloacetate decarboxylase gamma subunit
MWTMSATTACRLDWGFDMSDPLAAKTGLLAKANENAPGLTLMFTGLTFVIMLVGGILVFFVGGVSTGTQEHLQKQDDKIAEVERKEAATDSKVETLTASQRQAAEVAATQLANARDAILHEIQSTVPRNETITGMAAQILEIARKESQLENTVSDMRQKQGEMQGRLDGLVQSSDPGKLGKK